MAEHGKFLVPTLVTYESCTTRAPVTACRKKASTSGSDCRRRAGGLSIAAGAGVTLHGSDLLGPMRRHQGEEIGIKAGALGAVGAIIAATRTNAELLGLEQEIGTIEVGKQADLIVADGDVLEHPGLLGRDGGVLLVTARWPARRRPARLIGATKAPSTASPGTRMSGTWPRTPSLPRQVFHRTGSGRGGGPRRHRAASEGGRRSLPGWRSRCRRGPSVLPPS